MDEARHAVFFKRFMHEVCGIGDGSTSSGLEAIKPQLTVGFRRIFDRLDTMADELRADRSPPKLAAAVTLYHVVIEASLAQPGQHFIAAYLEERDQFPAFREGMANIATDEQRHIGFGVKLLSDLRREDPVGVPKAVAHLLHEVTRYTAQVLMPPNWDERYITIFNSSYDEVGMQGVESMATKLRSAGLAPETLPGPPILPPGLTPLEISERGRALAQAGIIGVREGPTRHDPETVELLFDMIRRQVNPDHGLKRATTFQWDFTDADVPTWHLTVDNGSSGSPRAPPGTPTCGCGSPSRTSPTSSASAWIPAGRCSAAACAHAATRSPCAGWRGSSPPPDARGHFAVTLPGGAVSLSTPVTVAFLWPMSSSSPDPEAKVRTPEPTSGVSAPPYSSRNPEPLQRTSSLIFSISSRTGVPATRREGHGKPFDITSTF